MLGSEAMDCLSSYSAVAGLLTKKVVVVHPIVLLSVVDHYNRVAKGDEWHATNSFALPFEEDNKDPNVWFLDQDYLQQLFIMFKKDMVVPAKAYCAIEEPTTSKAFRKSFVYVACTIGAYEAEEVGVEHLLRDTKNATTSTLATKVGDQLETLKMLARRLRLIADYLLDVAEGNLRGNATIIYHVQEIFNLLPDTSRPELQKAFATQTNDSMMTLYLATVVRSVLALHNLIDNKIQNKRDAEQKEKEATKAEEEKQKKAVEA
ncbi:26S proteasome regulatory subunit, putative [Eimeria maxima]|uniref:26S proteasome regulatory subunit, putative n=1 Tax=Eimeria maxima TaxID=5804 RepID=U6LXM4_EIMMA|nr:26S proteasome regulatory subunit, putative [Eimeria maxima]CDJ56702.1 26S proteasome regulatory subunit, putative [Eimeria maxima]